MKDLRPAPYRNQFEVAPREPISAAIIASLSSALVSAGLSAATAGLIASTVVAAICSRCSAAFTSDLNSLRINGVGRSVKGQVESAEALEGFIGLIRQSMYDRDPIAFGQAFRFLANAVEQEARKGDPSIPADIHCVGSVGVGDCLSGMVEKHDSMWSDAGGWGIQPNDIVLMRVDGDPYPRGKVYAGRLPECELTQQLFVHGAGECLVFWQWNEPELLLAPAAEITELRRISHIYRDGKLRALSSGQVAAQHPQFIDFLSKTPVDPSPCLEVVPAGAQDALSFDIASWAGRVEAELEARQAPSPRFSAGAI